MGVKGRMLCTISTGKYDSGRARRLLLRNIKRERAEGGDQSKRVVCIVYGTDRKKVKE